MAKNVMGIMTQTDAEAMVEEMLAFERGEVIRESQEEPAPIDEAALQKRPVDPGKPHTEAHLRDVLVDAQMRLAGASNFGYALVKAGEWEEGVRRGFEGEMDGIISRLQGVYSKLESDAYFEHPLTEAAGKSFWDYLVGAQEAFLNDAAKAIKKLAGGYAESVKVVRARSAVWLEYKGQDRSDMDMEATISMIVKEPDIHLHMDVKSVMHASWTREVQYKSGQLTTDNVVNLFQEAFGR